jgi:hypothetical protein
MRQQRWLELIKNYDLTINYTLGNANVVAGALSQKATSNMLEACRMPTELQKQVAPIYKDYWEGKPQNTIEIIEALTKMNMDLKGEILKRQKEDPFKVEEICRIDEGRQSMFELREEISLWFQNRICVPGIPEIKEVILSEAHQTPYSIHPRSTKMYTDLKYVPWGGAAYPWPAPPGGGATWPTS